MLYWTAATVGMIYRNTYKAAGTNYRFQLKIYIYIYKQPDDVSP